jgi:hypothetical protein
MQHKFCMHAVDRMFRDIKRREDKPFGEIIVVCFLRSFPTNLTCTDHSGREVYQLPLLMRVFGIPTFGATFGF